MNKPLNPDRRAPGFRSDEVKELMPATMSPAGCCVTTASD